MAQDKSHRKKKAGRKAEKRKTAVKKKTVKLSDADLSSARARNPKAFAFNSAGRAKAQRARTAEKEQKRLHAPVLERDATDPPPFVVLVHGPPQVGKSTLIRCLVKHYTRQNLNEVKGPVTVVAGKKRRLTFVECPNEMNSMIDAAKYADLVLLLIDGSFGFEMETFEFLNLLQVHGFPKVMGVLTHLDSFKDSKQLRRRKKTLKARFWTEIYQGAKLFYLSGIQYGKYLKREILNLARFISVSKFRPLSWRMEHPYVLVDRFEDVTSVETIRQNPKADRDVTVYGFLRGTNLKPHGRIHVAGVGDFSLQEVDVLPDPCPLPESIKRRGLNEKERLLYAPFADLGGLLYDKDAVYIDIPDWKVQFSKDGEPTGQLLGMGEQMMHDLQGTRTAVDEKLQGSRIQLFPGGKLFDNSAVNGSNGRLLANGNGALGSDSEEENGGDYGSEEEDDDISGSEDGDDEDEDQEDDGDDEDGVGEGDGILQNGTAGARRHAVVRTADGRVRRRALFGGEGDRHRGGGAEEREGSKDGLRELFAGGSDSDEEEEENELRQRRGSHSLASTRAGGNGGSDDEDEEEADDEGLGGAAMWKSHMLQRTASLFSSRAQELQDIVYGRRAMADGGKNGGRGDDDDGREENLGLGRDRGVEEEDDDEFFTLKRDKEAARKKMLDADDAEDTSLVLPPLERLSIWEDSERVESLRSRFVTGDWEEAGKRSRARPAAEGEDGGEDEGEDSDDVFGDFEDVETGEIMRGGDDVTAAAQRAIHEAAVDAARQKKLAKKAMFDSKYDEGNVEEYNGEAAEEDDDGNGADDGAGGGADGPGGAAKKKKQIKGGMDKEETFYDAIKRDLAAKAAETKAILAGLDARTRQEMEGVLPGAYIRIKLTGVPCELVKHLDPRYPLLLGGLAQGEESTGVMRLRFKRHRWSPKILKAQDPLVFSCGWRRFQSLPVYAIEDHNRRLRMLKYTPEHMHCLATIYGPLAPPGTGVVAVQNLGTDVKNWRISGTGVVTELDTGTQIVKKLKLVGTPVKVHRHTAFVSGMFTSQIEAAKFEGAAVRTASGIRGTVKKALRPGLHGVKDGAFRATFEDKPLMSDMVFLRAWVAVDVPRFFNTVTNLLAEHQPLPVRERRRPGDKHGREEEGGDTEIPPGQPPALEAPPSLGALPEPDAAPSSTSPPEFHPSSRFQGARPGFVFKLGRQGLGYYADTPLTQQPKTGPRGGQPSAAQTTTATPGESHPATDPNPPQPQQSDGWVGMRTLAQLRAALGVGAPRNPDSLYRPIERGPRKFNPLKVPKTLQAALPFRSKPKLEQPRKRKTLEQKRAVVLEPQEKKVVTMVQQLNAIRNEKRAKRREQQERHRQKVAKEQAKTEEWQKNLQKQERKKRYRAEGMAAKAKEHGKFGPKRHRTKE